MSGGEQQMLAMGRALMADPKLLLLDEPSLGLAPVIVDRIYETIREINQQGMTILLVEQNANYALDVSARGYVLETGTVALTDESGGAARERGSPEGLPGHMTVSSPSSATSAPWRWSSSTSGCSARSAARSSRSEGLRREAGPGHRAAAQRDRPGRLAADPVQAGRLKWRQRVEPPRPRAARPPAAAASPAPTRSASSSVGVPERGSPARGRAPGTTRAPVGDDLGHVAVEQPSSRGAGRAATAGRCSARPSALENSRVRDRLGARWR